MHLLSAALLVEKLPQVDEENYLHLVSSSTKTSSQDLRAGYTHRSHSQTSDVNHNFFATFNAEFPILYSSLPHLEHYRRQLNVEYLKNNQTPTHRPEDSFKTSDIKVNRREDIAFPEDVHYSGNAVKASSSTAKSQDDDNKKPLKCDQCGKIFKTKYTLAIHLKMPSHTNARPFVCGTCGKGFRLSSTLCRHKIIHTSSKPHQCHICNKAFNRSSTLKTHIRTHSDEKEFLCEVCGKGFHQKGNLRNHILIHTGEKPYKCNLCEKAFNKLSNLKFHLHVHTDNAPYRCRFCKVSFSRRCDLKKHLSAVHNCC